MSPYSTNNNFYTYEELKDYTNDFTDLTILNISKFIETKTKSEYAVVKRKMIVDFKDQLFKNNLAAFDIQRYLNEVLDKYKEDQTKKDILNEVDKFIILKWSEIVEINRTTIGKWKDELKDFDFQGGK